MKIYHKSLETKGIKRIMHISPLNISERSYTSSKLTVRLPSVETEQSIFPTLRPLNTEGSVSKLFIYSKPPICIKLNQAHLDLKSNDIKTHSHRPKIKKSNTNFFIDTKPQKSNFELSKIRMPLPQSYYNEIENMRLKIRKRSTSRRSRNKENITN